MTMIRKHYTPAFKTQVVQEALAGERTLAQIAAQYQGVSPHFETCIKNGTPASANSEDQRLSGEAGPFYRHVDLRRLKR